ncbi:MAG: hypothetical protein JWN86_781 [Planctomycetota bacterium]|nr:hypothetical protein [Planctomycetota bacterium]
MSLRRSFGVLLAPLLAILTLACLASLPGCEGCEPTREGEESSATAPSEREAGAAQKSDVCETCGEKKAPTGPCKTCGGGSKVEATAQGKRRAGSEESKGSPPAESSGERPLTKGRGRGGPGGGRGPIKPDLRGDAEVLKDALGRREKSQTAESKGRKSEAYEQAVSAWELVRSRSDPQCHNLAGELLADIERLGLSQNRSIRDEGDPARINNVPLISK